MSKKIITCLNHKPLETFLKQNVNKLSDVGQFKVFSDFKGTAEKLRINDKVTHIWKIPTTVNDAEYIVKSKDFKEEEPY